MAAVTGEPTAGAPLSPRGRSGRRRLTRALSGPAATRRLFGLPPLARPAAKAHGLIAAADALFAVSLAGSLFFSVSVDAARPRVLLYLLVTLAPFAVVAPLVGPVIDRVPGGQRLVITLTCVGRSAVCLLLAGELRTLLFYPLAFAVLVLGKTYSVAKNTLVPRLVADPEALVEANSRLSRVATMAGAPAAALGAAVVSFAGAPWSLRAGGVLYVAAAAQALRVPPPASAPSAPRAVARQELHAPRLRLAAFAMSILRGGVGFLLFVLAFALKVAGEPAWFFGVVFAAHGLGGLAGTFVAPRARAMAGEETLLTGALALPAPLALLASLGPGRTMTVVMVFAVGTSANAGRQAFDSLVQRAAPDVERGRLFARFESRFQLAWALGALLAVAVRPPLWAGFLLLGAVTGFGGISYAGRRRVVPLGIGPHSPPAPAQPVPLRLLATAERLRSDGELDQAVLVAAAAVEAVARDLHLDAATRGVGSATLRDWEEIQRLRRAAIDRVGNSLEDADRALAAGRRLVSAVEQEAAEGR